MTDENLVGILKNSSWFHSLTDDSLLELAEKVVHYKLNQDDVLIRKGDAGDSVFYINSGWVKIVAGDTLGGEVVLNHLGPGEFVGELSLVDQKPRSASVIALSEIEAIELKRDDFLAVLDRNPSIALAIIANTSSRMRFSSTYVEKAIQWSHDIAKGDYSFADEEREKTRIVDSENSDEARANRFLDAFFWMVQGIREREEELRQQLHQLTIEIDHAKRDEEIDAIIDSDIFKKIKEGTNNISRRPVESELINRG